jgi:uncharacterized protein YbaP (TraB family)
MKPAPRALLSGFCALLLAASAASAQTPPASVPDEGTEVEAVVVTARRIGIPVWTVSGPNSAVIFIGSIGSTPADVPWRTSELEAAVDGSRKVLHSAALSATMGDVYRLLFKRGRWTDLPEGESLDDRIDPALRARLARLATAGKLPRDYRRLRPWYAANRLNRGALRAGGLDDGASAFGVARRAARKRKLPVEPALNRAVKEVLDQAANQRTTDVACLQATASAAEAGAPMVRARALAWTRSRVGEVLASPLTQAEGLCFPDGEADLGPELRRAWRTIVGRELAQPGAVVAVVPLRYLAEPGGLLDDLSAQGYAVKGPAGAMTSPRQPCRRPSGPRS